MKPRAFLLASAGLALLAAAVWMVPLPRRVPRPAAPEIAPFAAGERIALVVPDPANHPPAAALGEPRRMTAPARVRAAARRRAAPLPASRPVAPARRPPGQAGRSSPAGP